MTRTYFTDRDIASLSDTEVVALATRQAHDIEDLEIKSTMTRHLNADQKRKGDLALGELIHLAAHPDAVINAVASDTSLTVGALLERRQVYALTVGAGVMETLLETSLSYSNHRTIVGVRVKRIAKGESVSIPDRVEAALRSIDRNGGYFKGDDLFYEETHTLPPPNSFERVLTCLENDKVYAKEKLSRTSRRRLSKVIVDTEDDRNPPHPLPPRPPETVADFVQVITDAFNDLTDKLDNLTNVPPIVFLEIENWEAKIAYIKDLAKVRAL